MTKENGKAKSIFKFATQCYVMAGIAITVAYSIHSYYVYKHVQRIENEALLSEITNDIHHQKRYILSSIKLEQELANEMRLQKIGLGRVSDVCLIVGGRPTTCHGSYKHILRSKHILVISLDNINDVKLVLVPKRVDLIAYLKKNPPYAFAVTVIFLTFLYIFTIYVIKRKIFAPLEEAIGQLAVHVDGSDCTCLRDGRSVPLEAMTINSALQKLLGLQKRRSDFERHAVLNAFTNHIAHDMRSPISVLKGYMENVIRFSPEEEKEYKEAAQRSVNKLLRMADDLVDYAKASQLKKSEVTLSELLKTRMQRCMNEKNIEFSYDLNGTVANMDGYKIERVLENILDNATQAIDHENGKIEVSAKIEGANDLVIKVSDNGLGVSDEHLSKIFDDFFTTGKKGGTGLGLSYCKQVVEAHGGTIDAESEVGKGTTFTIRIPGCVVPVRANGSEKDRFLPLTGQVNELVYTNRSFLLIDDDQSVRTTWKRRIKENGGKVVWEGSSFEEMSSNVPNFTSIDTAIVDYEFKGSKSNGIDIIKHLKSKGIKEIHLCTGYADDAEIRNSATEAGANSIIHKKTIT